MKMNKIFIFYLIFLNFTVVAEEGSVYSDNDAEEGDSIAVTEKMRLSEKLKKQEQLDREFFKKQKEEFQINGKYEAGDNLIYDCEEEYFTCVNKISFEKCSEARAGQISLNESKYTCAPLKEFNSKEECKKANYDMINRAMLRKFCYKPQS